MSIGLLFIVAGVSAFAIIWLINYIPLRAEIFNKTISPRLLFCKLLAPFDAVITLILITGSWLGLTTATLGISMMVYNAFTGIGISVGVLTVKKWFLPAWQKKYQLETSETEK